MKTRKNRSNRNRKQNGGAPFGIMNKRGRENRKAKRRVIKARGQQDEAQKMLDGNTKECLLKCMDNGGVDPQDINVDAVVRGIMEERDRARKREGEKERKQLQHVIKN